MKILFLSAFALFCSGTAFGQASPHKTETATISGKMISITYGAPSVRGRKIFGEGGKLSTDPTYPAWRAGADSATALHTDADLDIGGLAVPKGDYTLFVWVKNPDSWELIVNKQTGQWGTVYDASQDLGRVKMTMTVPDSVVETVTWKLTNAGGGKGKLELAWDKHIATLHVTIR